MGSVFKSSANFCLVPDRAKYIVSYLKVVESLRFSLIDGDFMEERDSFILARVEF